LNRRPGTPHTLGALAEAVGARVHGDADRVVSKVDVLDAADTETITFLSNSRYRKYLKACRAGAVVIAEKDLPDCPVDALVSDDPYLSFSRIAGMLYPDKDPPSGIHPHATVDPSARLGEGVTIEARAVIEAGAVIGEGCHIGAGCCIGREVSIGAATRLYPNVTVCDGVEIGARCRIHPGVVLGSDGFGLAWDGEGWARVPQLGGVRIGDDVDIGANTTVDRGALQDTVIEDGAKLDNLIQIAHNVEIGRHSALAGCTGIAGSARIGAYCTLAGGVGLVGHIELADHVHVTGMTMVTRSLKQPGAYSGNIPAMDARGWKKSVVRFRQLEGLFSRVRGLEKRLEQGE